MELFLQRAVLLLTGNTELQSNDAKLAALRHAVYHISAVVRTHSNSAC